MEKSNGRKIDRTGASRTVDRKLAVLYFQSVTFALSFNLTFVSK